MHTRTPYPYEHLQEAASNKLDPTGFEIDEVTTYASLYDENVVSH
jgi:hypothetical protein